jgi:lysophospholipid acyltransferase (LPLAT)-like uncharacterized protein
MPDLSPRDLRKAALIAGAASPFVATLGRTLKWRVEGEHYYHDIIGAGRQPVMALWHGRIFGALYYFRNRGIVVITSQNFDGEWIARILTRFGFGTARGSTSRGAARALVQLRRDLRAGCPVGFTVDGPRGPARVAQPGAVWLAGATGQPVLPLHVEADRAWQAGSWDRTQIPKPFATMSLVVGEPIEVGGTAADVVEAKTRELERALGALELRATAMLSGNTP